MDQKWPQTLWIVRHGQSAGNVARDAAEASRLHLIDIAFRAPLDREFAEQIRNGTVFLHNGDSVAMLERFPDDHFDWMFIDGDHSHEGVARDAMVAAKKVKPGGFLVFDDYIFYDHQLGEPYGVIHVVNGLCVERGWTMRYFALQVQMFCKAVLRRPRPAS